MHLPAADLQRLLAEEPFVRALAASLVADEADDVVQQAYLRALAARPGALRSPRAWLARVVRNLAADRRRRVRRERRAAADDRDGAAVHPLVPSSAELAIAEERRRALVAAVDALPPHLRTVVLLRWFEGLPPRRIARELAVPVPVVWNRLHVALLALRARLDAQHGGDRRAWLLPLVPFAAAPRALPWHEVTAPAPTVPALTSGAILMTTKTKLALAAVTALALVGWQLWPGLAGAAWPPGTARQPIAPETASLDGGTRPDAPIGVAERVLAGSGTGASSLGSTTTGDLVARVTHAAEARRAAGLTVVLERRGAMSRIGAKLAMTDADGVARFAGLDPGVWRVDVLARHVRGVPVDVVAGGTTECTLPLLAGVTLTGVVVDGAGAPVAGAVIEHSDNSECSALVVVATSAADGTFTVPDTDGIGIVGARARGYAASTTLYVRGEPGSEQSMRFELRAPGGAVEGTVVYVAGEPIANAVVRVGDGRTDQIRAPVQGAPPFPAQVTTDAEGRFVAIGVPVGAQPLQAHAAGTAPWAGTCDVAAGGTTAVRIVLGPGVTCRGTVRDETGNTVADSRVALGTPGDFVQLTTITDAHGAFELRGLAATGGEVRASAPKRGTATARVGGAPGDTVVCELTLSLGIVLRGRVLDESDQPLARAHVRAEAEGAARWSAGAFTEADGSFVIGGCPTHGTLALRATLAQHVPWRATSVVPQAGAVVVRLQRDTRVPARIVGRVLGTDGRGATGVEVVADGFAADLHASTRTAGADGAFALDVPPGAWRGRIEAKGHPEMRFDRRELQPGDLWDLGTLQLTRGGTLVVRDEPADELDFTVMQAGERWVCGVYSPARPLRSELLAPGEYLLLVRSPRSAPQLVPFTITSDRETAVDVRPVPGVRRRIELVPTAGSRPRAAGFDVRRDGRLVTFVFVTVPADGPIAADVCLLPGSYELVLRDVEPAVRAPFEMREGLTEPLRVALP